MKLKLLLFMGVFSALSSALSARDKVLSFLPPPNTPPTIVLATGQNDILRYCPGSPIANIEIVIDDSETLFKDLVVTFASSNQAYIADSEITAYPEGPFLGSVTNGQRYLGITGNTIIPPVFVNGFTDITITVTDGDGLTATQVVTIFIEDLSIPTIVKTGAIASGVIDKTLSSGNCDYKLEDFTGNVTVSDDCTDTPDIVVTQVATLNSITYNIGDTIPGQDGDVVLVTLTAEDLVGKTATTTFTITLQDETKPELTIILPVVNEDLAVDATDCKFTIKDYTQGVFANVSLVEACTPGATITQSPAAGTVVDYFETNQEQTIKFNCTDAAGNIADEVSFTVKVKDNTNPVAKSLAAKTVNLSSTINGGIYTFTAPELNDGSTDNCQIVSYTYLPAFVECDKAGTTVSVTMTVTDLSGNTATSSTDVTVLDVDAPVITVADIVIGTPTCLTSLLSDPTIDVVLTDNCTVLPSTLIGKRSDDLDIFTDPYPFGETTITWTVQDSVGNGATVTQKVTMNDNEFPEFVDATLGVLPSPSPLDQAFFNLSYDSLKDVGSTDVYPAANLLKPTVIDATDYTGCDELVEDIVLVPTPEFLHLGTNTVTWTATDIYGTIVSATQVVTIEDTTIPVITLKDASLLAPFTLDSNGQVVITPADLDNGTTDGFNGNALKLTVVPNTFGCESADKDVTVTFYAEDYVGSLGGIPSINPARISSGSNPLNQITDENGVVGDAEHKVYKQITVRIEDNFAPTVLTKNITVQLNASGTASIVASDVDNGSSDSCGIKSMSVTPNTFTCSDVATPVTVTLTVTDVNDNVSSLTAVVTVEDKIAPVITGTTVYIDANTDTNACGATVSVTPPTATDNCTVGSPIGTRSDSLALNALYPLGTTIITWKLTDANGNVALPTTTTIQVTDNIIPVITANGDKIVNNDNGICGAVVSVSATSTDNCSSGLLPTGVRNDGKGLTDVYPVGTTSITWTVTDANGNAAVAVIQSVKVTDNQKPLITSNGLIKNVNVDSNSCGAIVNVSATATDNCSTGLSPIGVRSDAKPLAAPFPVGTTTVTWNVSDNATIPNVAVTVTQTVTVSDNQKPVITVNGDKFVTSNSGCGATAIFVGASATATDNCTVGSPVGTRSDFLALTADYPVGTTTITWNVTDANSNAAVAVLQTVVVRDTQDPIVITKTYTAQLNASGTVTIVPADINNGSTDNCSITTLTLSKDTFTCANVGSNTVALTAKDASGNTAIAFATVIVEDKTAPVVVAKDISLVLDNGSVTIKPEDVLVSATDACGVNIASYSLSKDTFTITDVLASPVTITVYATDINGNIGSATAILTFPTPITATQVITPNGDGINDTWEVQNITNNTNSVVRVFNRWGSLVYSAKNYQNDWDGKLNGSDVTVPDGGSYYYQIDLKGTGNVDSEGWLYISRQ